MSTIAITGTLTAVSSRRNDQVGIAQAVDGIEGKGKETTIPHGGGTTAIPLDLSTGITEALIVAVYAPAKVILVVTSSDVTAPGPFRMGCQGWQFFSMYPGEGIASLSAINNDPTIDVKLETYVYALGAPTDQPPWWFPTSS